MAVGGFVGEAGILAVLDIVVAEVVVFGVVATVEPANCLVVGVLEIVVVESSTS
jgi:hypothetical protein